MSKSLKRVKRALEEAGVSSEILEMPGETRTAIDAAREVGCDVDQAKKADRQRHDVQEHDCNIDEAVVAIDCGLKDG